MPIQLLRVKGRGSIRGNIMSDALAQGSGFIESHAASLHYNTGNFSKKKFIRNFQKQEVETGEFLKYLMFHQNCALRIARMIKKIILTVCFIRLNVL